jgi:hypothetical protein
MADNDLLTTGLTALAVDAPAGLLDRVAARWVRVPDRSVTSTSLQLTRDRLRTDRQGRPR